MASVSGTHGANVLTLATVAFSVFGFEVGYATTLVEVLPAAGNAWHIAAGDVTGDGRDELIYACYNGDIYCQVAAGGTPLWKYETGAFPYDLVVEDVDGDGKSEALIASSNGTVYVVGSEGQERWRFSSPGPLYQVAVVRAGGIVNVTVGGADRKTYLLDAHGTLVRELSQKYPVRLLRSGDLDGDGRDEIVIGGHDGQLETFTSPELKRIWQVQLRGGKSGDGEIWRPYSLELADLDGDGRSELLLGSSFYNGRGIRALRWDGSPLWDEPDGFTFKDGTRFAQTMVVPYAAVGGGRGQVLALNACRLFVHDATDGRRLKSAAAPLPFTDICVADSGTLDHSVYLASGPNGDDRIYRVRMEPGWDRAFAGIRAEGRLAEIEENLARLRQQVLAFQGSAPRDVRYVHMVTASRANSVRDLGYHFARIEFFRRQFPYPSCEFAMGIVVAADELVPGFSRPDPRTSAWRLPPREIPRLLRSLETAGVPFIAIVGHSCEPQISLETAEQILTVCPKTCLGFQSSENSRTDSQLEHFMQDYWFPLMDLCKRRGKRAWLVEKGAWWATVPAMEKFRKLVDGTYSDVLVMSVENSGSRSPELNLAGRAGLFLAGAVNAWSARTIPDEVGWSRYWEWEYPARGHPFLRSQLAQALLGARSFEHCIEVIDSSPIRFNQVGSESVEILVHMLGKGLLIPPAPSELKSIAGCVIGMREPTATFLAEAFNFSGHKYFKVDTLERESPFSGLACYWGATPTLESYIGSYLLGQKRHWGNCCPSAPYGFPVILPTFLQEKVLPGRCVWSSDGTWFYEGDQRLTGKQARERVLADFARAAENLSFRVDGHVFWQSQLLPDQRFRITLVDAGVLDPQSREVTIVVQEPGVTGPAVDLLSGERIPVVAGKLSLRVPAGSLRIVEVPSAK